MFITSPIALAQFTNVFSFHFVTSLFVFPSKHVCFDSNWLDLSNITKVVYQRKRIGFRSRGLFLSWMSPAYQSWSLAIAKWCAVNKYCALRIQYGKGKSLSMHVYTKVRSKFSFEPPHALLTWKETTEGTHNKWRNAKGRRKWPRA